MNAIKCRAQDNDNDVNTAPDTLWAGIGTWRTGFMSTY